MKATATDKMLPDIWIPDAYRHLTVNLLRNQTRKNRC